MALPIYIVSLALSSGATAAVARKILQGFGYVPSVQSGLLLTAGLAALFAAAQLAYLAFMRLTAPSRGTAPLLFETLSNAAALTFLPYLAGISFIPFIKLHAGGTGAKILDKVSEKLSEGLVEPALLIGVFLAAHCFLKLLSFFSATESRPAGRWPAFVWAAAAAACALGGEIALKQWTHTLDAARNMTLADPKPVAIDGTYARARALPLGADMKIPLEGHTGENFTLSWALARDYEFAPTELHITVQLDANPPFQKTIPLQGAAWLDFRPFTDPLPEGAKTCTVSWDFAKDSTLALKWGIRRPPSATDTLWVAGPFFAAPVDAKKAPNIVILAIDGIATARLKSEGYPRDTMPVLENLAKSALYFPTCVSPAPEAAASCMTLLTGKSPLEHGYLGKHKGPLPEADKTLAEILHDQHYATAAFTEADWQNHPDLGQGSGFERGFDTFDPSTPLEAARTGKLPGAPVSPEHAGSDITLDKAADWADAHAPDRFLLFVRLREAGAPAPLARYGNGFITNRAKPDPSDIYDTALNAVDKTLPAFLDRLKARGLTDKTIIVITSPCGLDPDHNPANAPELSDATTMVPLLIITPGATGKNRNVIVGTEDIAPTLLQMLTPPLATLHGTDLRGYNAANEEISMAGDPVVLSLRNRRWRFNWSTGQSPYTREPLTPEAPLALINIEQSRSRHTLIDDLPRYPEEAQRSKTTLQKYLTDHTPQATLPPK